ncbi:MAG: hypothetical protein ABW360_08460 [Phenylobacterium sp.]
MLRPLLIAALVMASPAAAQPQGPPGPRLFISPSGEPFRGGDGLAAWLAGADADHDGAVTLAEFRADAQRWFQVLDANHDGVVDGFETHDYERNVVPEITRLGFEGGPGARDGGGPPRGGGFLRGRGGGRGPAGSGREGAARFSLINEPQPVAGADGDLDSKVTAAEWARATTRRFERLDVAKTGRLTRESLRPPEKKRR